MLAAAVTHHRPFRVHPLPRPSNRSSWNQGRLLSHVAVCHQLLSTSLSDSDRTGSTDPYTALFPTPMWAGRGAQPRFEAQRADQLRMGLEPWNPFDDDENGNSPSGAFDRRFLRRLLTARLNIVSFCCRAYCVDWTDPSPLVSARVGSVHKECHGPPSKVS